jgi:1A family penicillin-binding protein
MITRKQKIRILILKGILLLGIAGFLFVGGSVIWAATLNIPDFDAFFQERVISESTKIYDRTGEIILYDVHGTIKRTVIPLEDIADYAQKATLAIEDAEFYEHQGIKPSATLRAVLINLSTGQLQQGGSTITQQVIKNTLLTKEKKISRKIKEWVLALKLERVMDKDQILNLYFNETPYGGSIYGIEEAARAYFGKSAKDLNLVESAYLAALPQAPTYYSPYGNNRDKLEDRKNLVLKRMAQLGFITDTEADQAKTIAVKFERPDDSGIKAPHFVIYVLNYLEEQYGREAVETGGYKVTTSLDWELQKQAEEIISRYAEDNSTKYNANNAAMTAIDPKTGQLLVMVGSKDYFDEENDGNFNIALAHRQPGSAFKPFVYASAFEKGFTTETVVFDLKTQFSTNCPPTCYSPENYDSKYLGPITFRDALAQSRNVPAVKVLYLAGINQALDIAKRFGITSLTDKNRYGLTLVLGGGEVSLLELTGAYSVFANDGIKSDLVTILKIEDNKGKTLEEWKLKQTKVVDSLISRMVTSILTDNNARIPAFGTNSPLYFPGREVAAKTGTTNDYRDAWIIGYTPSIAVGTWAGNNDNRPMDKQIAGFIVAPMWNAFMQSYLSQAPAESFPPTPTIDPNLKPVLRGYWQGNENYYLDSITNKQATEYTPQETKLEKVVVNIHSILHWVNKNDPTGPAPTNPANDPQYRLWEEPVRIWVLTQGIVEQDKSVIPNEFDDIHQLESKPDFTLITPTNNQIINNNNLAINLELIKNKNKIKKIEVYLNNYFIKTITGFDKQFNLKLKDDVINIGNNEFKVIIYDDLLNYQEKIVNLIFN